MSEGWVQATSSILDDVADYALLTAASVAALAIVVVLFAACRIGRASK